MAKKYPLAMTEASKTAVNGKSRKASLKKMKPASFLKESRPLKVGAGDRAIIDEFKKQMKHGDPMGPLKLYNDGSEDGRHRAKAAEELGIGSVPVVDYRKGKKHGGALLEDKYPTEYLPKVGRQVMQEGGGIVDRALEILKNFRVPDPVLPIPSRLPTKDEALDFAKRAITPVDPYEAAGEAVRQYRAGHLLDALETGLSALPQTGSLKSAAPGIIAYHGSPHSFDRFDLSKIGTGEGAQAYGHGLYFAEHEPVAKQYREFLSSRSNDLTDPGNLAASLLYRTPEGTREAAIREAQTVLRSIERMPAAYKHDPGVAERTQRALEMLQSGAELPAQGGHMYQVRINADPEHFLDWDRPLSEQSRHASEIVQPFIESPLSGTARKLMIERANIPDIVNLRSPEITKELSSTGIPGIRYLDQGSRAAGEGSRNYVVFDDKLIDILRKYAKGGIVPTPQHMKGGGAPAPSTPTNDPYVTGMNADGFPIFRSGDSAFGKSSQPYVTGINAEGFPIFRSDANLFGKTSRPYVTAMTEAGYPAPPVAPTATPPSLRGRFQGGGRPLSDAARAAIALAEKYFSPVLKSARPESAMQITHQVSPSLLPKIQGLGALPSPSLGIGLVTHDPMDFGDISLIGRRHLAIPSEKNPIYGQDVWTPTVPPIKHYDIEDFLPNNPEKFSGPGFFSAARRQHVPATPENIVEHMTRRPLIGGEYLTGMHDEPDANLGYVVASLTPKFQSIEDVMANRGRLVSREEFDRRYEALKGQHEKLASGLQRATPLYIADEFDPAEHLGRAILNYERRRGSMLGAPLKEAYPGIGELQRDWFKRHVEDIRNLPSSYFEAKPQRVVEFGEFGGAAVPIDKEKEVAPILRQMGIEKIVPYERFGPKRDRRGAIEQFPEFSFNRGGRAHYAQAGGVQEADGDISFASPEVADALNVARRVQLPSMDIGDRRAPDQGEMARPVSPLMQSIMQDVGDTELGRYGIGPKRPSVFDAELRAATPQSLWEKAEGKMLGLDYGRPSPERRQRVDDIGRALDVAHMAAYLHPATRSPMAAVDFAKSMAEGTPIESALAAAFLPGGKYARAAGAALASQAEPEEAQAGALSKIARGLGKYVDPASKYISEWEWRPLKDVAKDIGTNVIPPHVQDFGHYMNAISDKAATEGLDAEDLIKGYVITRASIQRAGLKPAKLAESGVLLRETADPLVRPEGQMAEWLQTRQGKRFVNEARKGKLSQESVDDAMRVMAPYGLHQVEPDAMDWARLNLPEKTPIISDIIKRARTGDSPVSEWRELIQGKGSRGVGGIRGIKTAKPGFLGAMYGRGDIPTMDARQAILHTGMKNADVQDIMSKRAGKVGDEVVDRLIARLNALKFKGLPKELEPYYQHLAHHTTWESGPGNEPVTHADVIRAMYPRASGGSVIQDALDVSSRVSRKRGKEAA